jgi:hypothetical protein
VMMHRTSAALAIGLVAWTTVPRAEIIGDKDWRQPPDTLGMTWSQVDSVCGTGVCSGGTGALSTLNGWRWATEVEVQALFESLIDPEVINFPNPVGPNVDQFLIYEQVNSAAIDAAIGPSLLSPTQSMDTYERISAWARGNPMPGTNGRYAGGMINGFEPTGIDSATILFSSMTNLTVPRGAWLYRPLAEVPLPGPLVIPDLNADGVAEIGVVREQPIRAEIRSGSNGALLNTVEFLDPSVTLIAAEVLPDSDGNGVAEIAVLGSRNADGRGVVEMRNASGSPAPRQVWFATNQRPVGLAVVGADADGNGIAEIAVLSTRRSDGRGLVEVKNAYGATSPVSIWAGAGLTPRDLEIVPDADANGVPEVAILASRDSDGRIVVEIKNAAGATNPNSVWFMAGNTATDLAVVPDSDGNGIAEVAVLSTRNSDGRVVVEVKNAAGATNASALWTVAGQAALAVDAIADADGNGVPEIAVMTKRNSDGRVVVEVKNARGAANAAALWYPAGFAGRGLAVLPDVDGNGTVEAGALLMRNTDNRILVQSRNASGAQLARDFWFSP